MKGLNEFKKVELTTDQQELNEKLITFGGKAYPKFGNVVLLAGGAGCHIKGTEVLMYDGSHKKVEDIVVGDLLMGTDSTKRTVNELHYGIDKMVSVESKVGNYISNFSHIHTFVASFDKCGYKKDQVYDMTLEEYTKLNDSTKKSLKIFRNEEIEFEKDSYSLNIDPWIVGFWLGDGTRKTPSFTIENNSQIINYIKDNYEGKGYIFNTEHKQVKPNCKTYSLITESKNNPFRDYVIEKCEINSEKRIPKELLLSSIVNRKKVLAGLIDSDGYYGGGVYEICTKWESLKNDIEFLCGSLGYKTNTTIKKVNYNGEIKEYQRITISGNFKNLPIVLDYKKSHQNKNKNPNRGSFKICILDEMEYYGFSIKENDKHFILKNWIVQHNSGKGFIKDNLLGIEGQVYDVDEVKQLALKSDKIKKMAQEATGKDISTFDLKNPDDVGTLHTILDETLNVIDKRKLSRYAGILMAPADRKPNLIFDVTLKNLNKLRSISADIKELGYEGVNTHLVWVINSYNVAMAQNKERSRQVPEEILMDTHRGAAQTAKDILDMGKDIKKYLDGDIWYAFNKRGVDSIIAKSNKGGSYIKDANYIKVKEAGKPINNKKVTDEVVKKIAGYVPPSNYWG